MRTYYYDGHYIMTDRTIEEIEKEIEILEKLQAEATEFEVLD